MCRGCERVRSSSSRIGERKDSPDPHERTAAILLAEALRTHGNFLALPSSAEGLRLHPRPYGEGCALSAGTPRRLRKAKQLPSRDRTDRKHPRVHRVRQGTPRRDFQIGGVQALSSQLLRNNLPKLFGKSGWVPKLGSESGQEGSKESRFGRLLPPERRGETP